MGKSVQEEKEGQKIEHFGEMEKHESIRLKSFAKINLTLDITGILEDGYHAVDTIMQKVYLWDELSLEWDEEASEDFRIEIRTNRSYLPCDERNLAYKAAVLFHEQAAKEKTGLLKIDIQKKIPVAAGLAGGSGNAAAVIIGLNRLWKCGRDTRALAELSEGLGADVPFMVLIGNSRYETALGTHKGEKLRPLKKGLEKYVVLAKPKFGVSTKEVFAGMDSAEIKKRPDQDAVIKGLKTGDGEAVYRGMENVLEAYTLSAYPAVNELKEKVAETEGIEKVLMSGSGPTVIGYYSSKYHARKAGEMLRRLNYEAYWAATFR